MLKNDLKSLFADTAKRFGYKEPVVMNGGSPMRALFFVFVGFMFMALILNANLALFKETEPSARLFYALLLGAFGLGQYLSRILEINARIISYQVSFELNSCEPSCEPGSNSVYVLALKAFSIVVLIALADLFCIALGFGGWPFFTGLFGVLALAFAVLAVIRVKRTCACKKSHGE
jgi:hypothetical protein